MATAALLCAGFASCSQDDLPGQNDPLPEGQYPITFTAVQSKATPEGAVQTRVSDKGNGSSWTAGDRIKVTVDGNGYTTPQEVTCTLDEYGKVTDYSRQLYWQTADATAQFTGVYPVQTENISLNQQHNALAYVMRATATGSLNTPAKLTFTHRLAKLCVMLKDESGQILTDGYKLSVLNYASCDNTSTGAQGNGNLMFIPMRYNDDTGCYEANIVPGTFNAGSVFYRIQKTEGGKTYEATAKLTKASTFTAGYVYSATVTEKNDKWVPVVTSIPPEGIEIDGDVIISSPWSNKDRTIKVTNDAHITIRGLSMGFDWQQSGKTAISIAENVSLTLKVEGNNNNFNISSGAGIEMQNGSSLTIIGDGRENSKLTIKTNAGTLQQSNICIGAVSCHKDGPTEVQLGKIIIKDVSLELTQGPVVDSWYSAAAIGLSYGLDSKGQSCDGIEIDNASVTVTNKNEGACIGIGALQSYISSAKESFSITSISIKDSYIKATAEGGGACIGFGVKTEKNMKGSIGNITISNTGLDLTTKSGSGAFQVGRGKMNTQDNPPTITNNIVVNGKTYDKVGCNP